MDQWLYVAGGLSLGLIGLSLWLADPQVFTRRSIRRVVTA